MPVTAAQLDFYKEDGYVVIEDALDDADLDPLINVHELIVDEIAQDLHKQGRIISLHTEESFATRLARLAQECEQIDGVPDIGNTRRRAAFDFLRNQHLVDVIEPFIGPEISCNPVSHVRPKMPGTDVVFHQDAIFTTQEAKDILQVTVWIPLVAATPENGCLQIQPRVHRERTVYWNFGQDLPDAQRITVPMGKGDVMIMHKLTPHGSGPNRTDVVRWSMDLRYQKTGEPSPRPEWPSLIARSRRDPGRETLFEDWRDAWAAALAETPEHVRYPRPDHPQPYEGQMYL